MNMDRGEEIDEFCPTVICLSLLLVARQFYPRPHDLEVKTGNIKAKGLPSAFWIYMAGAALVAAGFTDFPLIANIILQRLRRCRGTWFR